MSLSMALLLQIHVLGGAAGKGFLRTVSLIAPKLEES